MEELLYLSMPKLERFLPVKSERRKVSSVTVGGGTIAGQGSLSIAMSARDERMRAEGKLRRIRDELETSALWYSDPDADFGSWIQFEGDLSYGILETESSALFLMSQSRRMGLGDTGLLLHGNPRNLLIRDAGRMGIGELDSYVANLARISSELCALEGYGEPNWGASQLPARQRDGAVVSLFRRMQDQHDGIDYVRGLAKVSLSIPVQIMELPYIRRIVAASPLFVSSVARPR
jgi:hypothetical protein